MRDRQNIVMTSFLLVAVLEFGDKTQIAVITLAAEYNAPVQVFIGVMLAYALLTGLAVAFGTVLCKYLTERYIRIGSGLLFLFFGVLFLLEAIFRFRFF